jgi:hypothetical protein
LFHSVHSASSSRNSVLVFRAIKIFMESGASFFSNFTWYCFTFLHIELYSFDPASHTFLKMFMEPTLHMKVLVLNEYC